MKPILTSPVRRQRGATLLVGMIMLVVLTLLVVFAIRSSNTGLQVAGNMQAQVESTGATQKAIETLIEEIKLDTTTDLLSPTVSPKTISVTVGDKTFPVAIAALVCEFDKDITNKELNRALAADKPCFAAEDDGSDIQIDASGGSSDKLSECRQQRWKIEATVADVDTGANVTLVQGIATRVGKVAAICP